MEPLAEGLAADQLHDDPIDLFFLDNVVDLDDGRMIEPGNRLGFTAQPRAGVGEGRIRTDPLGGDLAFQPLVPGPPHRAHATVSERLLQAIGPHLPGWEIDPTAWLQTYPFRPSADAQAARSMMDMVAVSSLKSESFSSWMDLDLNVFVYIHP